MRFNAVYPIWIERKQLHISLPSLEGRRALVLSTTHFFMRLFFADNKDPVLLSSAGLLLGLDVEESMVGIWGSPENRFSSSFRAFNSSGGNFFSLAPKILSSGVCCERIGLTERHQGSILRKQLTNGKKNSTYSSISNSSLFSKPGPK